MPDDRHPRDVDPCTFPGSFADACERCGQTRVPGTEGPCACAETEPETHEAMRLFTPPAAQIGGQLGLIIGELETRGLW